MFSRLYWIYSWWENNNYFNRPIDYTFCVCKITCARILIFYEGVLNDFFIAIRTGETLENKNKKNIDKQKFMSNWSWQVFVICQNLYILLLWNQKSQENCHRMHTLWKQFQVIHFFGVRFHQECPFKSSINNFE